jgi:hypothetical protein
MVFLGRHAHQPALIAATTNCAVTADYWLTKLRSLQKLSSLPQIIVERLAPLHHCGCFVVYCEAACRLFDL